jgi:hypothetical protein
MEFLLFTTLASEKHSSLTLPASMESVGVLVNTQCEFSARIADERNNPVVSNQLRVVCEPSTVTKLSIKKAANHGMHGTGFCCVYVFYFLFGRDNLSVMPYNFLLTLRRVPNPVCVPVEAWAPQPEVLPRSDGDYTF